MDRHIGLRWSVIGILFAAVLASTTPVPAFASETHRFDIPAQIASEAIDDFASQANVQILVAGEKVKDKRLRALAGEYSTQEALALLLADSGLAPKYVGERSIALVNASTKSTPVTAVESSTTGPNAGAKAGRSFWNRFRLAQSAEATPASASEGADSDAAGDREFLQEIVVTAQKKEERLQDVPVPVTAINAQTLTNNSQLQLQDYYNKVPGLGLAVIGDGGKPTVIIRGITSGGISNPTVGVVVDDVPYGLIISPSYSPTPPDVDPGDLARIEVLRGPQGALYGASSLGGLLKFVTVDPSTTALTGRIQGGFESTRGDLGYTLRGSVNVPLSDTLAVRASGFSLRNPGYIDNVQTDQHDINRRDSEGARLSALWIPHENLSVKLSAMYQDSERRGSSEADGSLGELKQSLLRGTGVYDRNTQAYSAVVTGTVNGIQLTSISGYNVDKIDTNIDVTPFLSFLSEQEFDVAGAPSPETARIINATQEFRASIPVGNRVNWAVGAFYVHEQIRDDYQFLAADADSGNVVGSTFSAHIPTTYEEYAAFTNLTFDITDRFDIQLGGRYSHNNEKFSSINTGPGSDLFYGEDPHIVPETRSKENAFTYLVTPRLRVSPDLMAYARFASGYRPGSPNAICGQAGVPCQVDHDTTRNYEVGVKGSFLNRAVSFDASVYRIDWSDIQISVQSSQGSSYLDNGSKAKSQGIELAMETQPLKGMTLAAWVAFNEAELTQDFPLTTSNVFGRSGDRLPYSSPFSGSLSIDQQFPVGGTITAFFGGTVSYVDNRKGTFKSTAERQTFPSYTQVDVRAGASLGDWSLNAYINNATDKRGILRGGLDSNFGVPTVFSYIQPRTVGLSLSKTFD